MIKAKYIAIAAITLDGKIAKDSQHLSTEWTSEEDKIFFRKLLKTCDVVVIGSKTFETAKEPLSKRNCVVLTRKVANINKETDRLVYLNTDQADLKQYIQEQNFTTVAVLGGAQVYTYCLENNLIDELYLTIEPLVFGKGVDLFSSKNYLHAKFKLESIEKLNEQGSLLLRYKR